MINLKDDKVSINNIDRKLIEDLCNWEITREEFRKQTDFKVDYETLTYLLDISEKYWDKDSGDNKMFREVFWELPSVLSEKEELNVYRKYLLVEWHHEHEEMAGAFQVWYNKEKDNIPFLLQCIALIPEYLKKIDPYPYVRKLIYAIGAQPEPYNIDALEKLVNNTTDEEIKSLALHQIEKRKRLGRWEVNKK